MLFNKCEIHMDLILFGKTHVNFNWLKEYIIKYVLRCLSLVFFLSGIEKRWSADVNQIFFS